jgi:hypothetical protein
METEIVKKMSVIISNEIDNGNSIPLHAFLSRLRGQNSETGTKQPPTQPKGCQNRSEDRPRRNYRRFQHPFGIETQLAQ